MKKRSKHTQLKLISIVFFMVLLFGTWILWSHSAEKSTIELNEDVAFEQNRTILKMKKDSLLMLLHNWQTLKNGASIKKRKTIKKAATNSNISEEDNWIVWKYDDRYKRGIMQEFFGDEAKYKKDSTIFWHDKANQQLRFKVQADTAYVYVRFITQYYSVLE
ncbi:hypothetical protein KORDIASMS9_03018 [Kordia sp. SMS9]|uniref:hypothetical protein n=1 Tax=Kordia sp. SMS9 TaxID=2282170 RepID=UPI000E0DD762|nr:hypothetical protein [Kordia sp. SMS9]AXG70772.1 hypothetical protein KORDIASMS9_03018 [Kordia sp. SMS9]